MCDINSKLSLLEKILNDHGHILIALSGGVDSVFLLTFARKVLGEDKVAAITADGPIFARDEVEYAVSLCDMLGISHKRINMEDIMSIIKNNPKDRCYHCKKEIFSRLCDRAAMTGCILCDGTNLDDLDDYRPGYKALQELDIASPLKDAGLTKAEIRQNLETLALSDSSINNALITPEGIPMWEKPAFACLASRIPYGETISEEKLTAVYKAEAFMRSLGFKQIRVRHHGDIARIEVLPEDRSKLFNEELMDKINSEISSYGFQYVAMDLSGYKMGNLNK